MEPQDERALDHAYAHTKAIRRFLRCEARIQGKPVKAPRRKALRPERIEQILAAMVAAYPARRDRPTCKMIGLAAGCTPHVAMEARRVAIATGRWPYATG